MELLEARAERRPIGHALGGEAGGVARHALAHLAHETAAAPDGEHQAGGGAHHQQHHQRVQVDARVQPHRAGPGRTRA